MAGVAWTSADLLDRFNRLAGRPSADAMTDATKYQRLADAQSSVFTKITSIKPSILYGAPAALTTSDGGSTFQYGTDGDGYPLFPLGKAGIFPSLNAVPTYPWRPGIDYLDEGVQIRMPNNLQYSGTLYWYGITPPAEMSASVQPILQPPASRILIVIEAVRTYAEEFARNQALASAMERKWEREFGPWMTQLRRHVSAAGGAGAWGWLAPWGRPGGLYGPGWAGAYWG